MCGTPPGGRLTDGKIEVAGLHSCVPHLVQHDPTSIPPINIACVFPAIEDAEDAIDELLARLADRQGLHLEALLREMRNVPTIMNM